MIEALRALAPYHDYGWFLALIAWTSAALILRFPARGSTGWAWLPWVALGGGLSALLELLVYAWPLPDLFGVSGRWIEDVILGVLSAVAVAGMAREWRARGTLRTAVAIAAFAAAGLRVNQPGLGAVALAILGGTMAIVHALQPEASRASRVALGAFALALWFTSAGPLASSGLQLRHLIPLGEWSPVWSAAQALAAATALLGVMGAWFREARNRDEWRAFVLVCAAWLLLGLGLAAAMSGWARQEYEAQAVARARVMAALMNKTALQQLLGPDFKFGEISIFRREAGGEMWQAPAPQVVSPLGRKVQHELAVVEVANDEPGFYAIFETLRAGWIVSISSERYAKNQRTRKLVGLQKVALEDWRDWSERRARFLPVLREGVTRASNRVYVRAPVVTDGGEMLGWLAVEFPRSRWVAAQIVPRFQAFLIVGLGLSLAGLIAVQRVQHRAHESARAAAAAAAQADGLKTAFLAKVSHELRTPIQSVLGYGELLRGAVHDPVARRRLAALREHGELMLRLVNDLLDLSAIHAGAFRLVPRPTALGDLISQTIESLRPGAEAKGLALAVTVAPEIPPWTQVDRERVRQVILNLVGNAIKFTERGRVDVGLETGARPDEIRFVVRDTGPGIPVAELGKLFQPFGRLVGTSAKEGTGLGLALTAGICRGMHGDVSAESATGGGATFRAWFRAPACAAPPNLSQSSGALPILAGRHVLVADDNALVRELFVSSLEEAGAQCAAARDGEEALAAVERATFDVIVLDLSMPRLDGIEVARRLRAGNRPMRIIGVSAHAGEREKEEALAAGMDAFLVKPLSLSALLSAIVPSWGESRPAADATAELFKRLREQFHRQAASEGAALAAAIQAGDFPAAHARAHHLMNSAAAVKDNVLFDASVQVETAARCRDAEELRKAWLLCAAALEPWKKPAGAARAN